MSTAEILVLNRKLLEEVIQIIQAEPAMFNMCGWGITTLDTKKRVETRHYRWPSDRITRSYEDRLSFLETKNICGTICCIAGHILQCHDAVRAADFFAAVEPTCASYLMVHEASTLLGITQQQGNKLFYIYNWPQPWHDRISVATLSFQEEAEIAISLLQAVLDTNGAILNEL